MNQITGPSANVTVKPWGQSERLAQNIFRNTVKPGGFCSIHRHAAKNQVILCLSGELTIEDFETPESEPSDSISLCLGCEKTTFAGQWHRFTSPQGAVFVEVYLPTWPDGSEPEDSDIERATESGCVNAFSL